eukprot:TRINITY_DN14871_c0_g1_i1.p1 TRINITY_DN14871_c0_g1~~TRINITY_DN14871_c0_g1_i1.p1  ORF type:complete len:263 (-),score=39.74 TRINITY_DN14871_c0_g1_i1:204-992(-)
MTSVIHSALCSSPPVKPDSRNYTSLLRKPKNQAAAAYPKAVRYDHCRMNSVPVFQNWPSTQTAVHATSTVNVNEVSTRIIELEALDISPENFSPFGQVLGPLEDGCLYGPQDFELDLSQGIPRFYIMRLKKRQLGFCNITHHASVTQCLGSVDGEPWFLGVAPPSIISEEEALQGATADRREPKRSAASHFYLPPRVEDVKVFRIGGSTLIKLHRGTWHAGPLFSKAAMDFANLELSDTNEVDHTCHDFDECDAVRFVVTQC